MFFEERHRALSSDLLRIGTSWRTGGREPPERIGRVLGQRHGLFAFLIPEALGGFPVGKPDRSTYVDVRSLSLIRELLAQVDTTADSVFAVQGLSLYPLVLAGTQEQRERLLRPALMGERVGGFALTEPEAGSDVAALKLTARREPGGDSFVLDGSKVYISNVGIADYYTVFANAEPASGRKGICAFLVERGTPGLTERAIELSIEHPIGALDFRDCKIPTSAMIGGPGEGFKLAMRTLDTFRVTVGAAAIGMARVALEETLRHVRARIAFGKPLSEHSIVQTHLAEMACKLDAARLLVYRAAFLADQGQERTSTEVSMAKLYSTEAAFEIIDMAVQLHGAIGVTAGNTVEALYREIRPLRIYEGASDVQRLIIATGLLREPMTP